MKTLLVLLTLVLGFTASASVQYPNGYKLVSDEKMDDYKKAVVKALNENFNAIGGCDLRWVNDTLARVEDILLSETSAQPLLIYNSYYYGINDERMHRLIFTSDASLKKITKVEAEIYKKGEINQGDLSNPDFVEDYILQGKWNCARPQP